MVRVDVPVKVAALMKELNASQNMLQNLEGRGLHLLNREFIHLEGHDVCGKGFIQVVYLVDAYLFGLDDILPQLLVQGDGSIH